MKYRQSTATRRQLTFGLDVVHIVSQHHVYILILEYFPKNEQMLGIEMQSVEIR